MTLTQLKLTSGKATYLTLHLFLGMLSNSSNSFVVTSVLKQKSNHLKRLKIIIKLMLI